MLGWPLLLAALAVPCQLDNLRGIGYLRCRCAVIALHSVKLGHIPCLAMQGKQDLVGCWSLCRPWLPFWADDGLAALNLRTECMRIYTQTWMPVCL